MKFFAEVFLYTFFIFGIIVFIREVYDSIKYSQSNNSIILLFDNNYQDLEIILDELSSMTKQRRFIDNVYILIKDSNDDNRKIIENIAEYKNISIINSNDQLIDFFYH